ncbi:MAG TPA: pentapeptide repeat-containing protein, partial [Azospirillum sp.]
MTRFAAVAALAATLAFFLPAGTAAAADAATKICPFCSLKGANLSGQDLTDANLQGADLQGADLSNAVLDGANLAGANLSGAKLTGASLKASAKGPADLSLANLSGADFTNATLGGADLQHADLTGAKLTGADLTDAITVKQGTVREAATATSDVSAAEATVCGKADTSALKASIHVAPGGTDGDACGTSAAQACATIAKGIARCTGTAGCGVLVAWGQYTLTDTIVLQDGVNVYGGCMPAAQAGDGLQSLVSAPADGKPAMSASNANGTGITVQGFRLMGSAAAAGGNASVTLLASSAKLTVKDSRIAAGAGSDGANGKDGGAGTAGGGGSGRTAGTNASCQNTSGGKGGSARTVDVIVSFTSYSCDKSCSENDCAGYQGQPGQTGFRSAGGKVGSDVCSTCASGDPGAGTAGGDGTHGSCGSAGAASDRTAGTVSGAV